MQIGKEFKFYGSEGTAWAVITNLYNSCYVEVKFLTDYDEFLKAGTEGKVPVLAFEDKELDILYFINQDDF